MGRKRSKGKSVKKNNHAAHSEPEEVSRAPHSFVIHKGTVGRYVQELARDFRKVMEPFTASNIKIRPKNVVKDFVHVAGMLHVSHLCMFTKTEIGPYLKLARFPRGPTMTFSIQDYSLSRDVRSALKRQVTYEKQFDNHPLLIMNSFSGEGREIQLMSSMFQNMFPSINVTKVKLNTIRRCVLLNYDPETQTVDFRHYTIKVVPVGMSKGVKKIVQGKIPNLGRYDEAAEFLTKPGNLSESEFEDDEANHVTLPQQVSSRGNLPSEQSSIRLVELGPRMKLQLIKIEDGLLDGEVLYHRLIEKTDEEKRLIKVAREKKRKEKEKRRKQQEANVKDKLKKKEEHKDKSLAGMNKKKNLPEGFHDGNTSSEDNDEEWYEKEVGEKPEKDVIQTGASGHKRKHEVMGNRFNKKPRRDGARKDSNTSPKFKIKLGGKGKFGGGAGAKGKFSGGGAGKFERPTGKPSGRPTGKKRTQR